MKEHLTKRHRDSIALSMYEHKLSKATKEQIALKMLGHSVSNETKQKLKEFAQKKIRSAKLFERHLYDSSSCGEKFYSEKEKKIKDSCYYRGCPICGINLGGKVILVPKDKRQIVLIKKLILPKKSIQNISIQKEIDMFERAIKEEMKLGRKDKHA